MCCDGKRLHRTPVPDHSDDATTMEKIDIFHTSSVFYDLETSTTTPVPVYHGHLLRGAMIDTGEYMALSVDDDGTFVYNYLPRSDYEPRGYNLTRPVPARLYSRWSDAELLEGIKKAMEHLLSHVQACQVPHSNLYAKCVVEEDDHVQLSKLGINAMTVLAIAEYMKATKDTSHVKVVKDLATYVRGSKREDGSFVHRVNLPKFDLDDDHFVREYHGQVAFALSSLYNVVQSLDMPANEQWLEVATAAAKYQVTHDKEEEDDNEFIIDQWLLYAIGELPTSKMEPDFVEHAIRSIHVAFDHQNGEVDDEDELDELGIFSGDLSATATAVKTEGLCAVYHVVVEQQRSEEANIIVESLLMGLRHQLQAQYQPEHAMYMRNPKRILGGFHESIIDTEMRLDHTYHYLCSLLCTADMMAHKTQGIKASDQ